MKKPKRKKTPIETKRVTSLILGVMLTNKYLTVPEIQERVGVSNTQSIRHMLLKLILNREVERVPLDNLKSNPYGYRIYSGTDTTLAFARYPKGRDGEAFRNHAPRGKTLVTKAELKDSKDWKEVRGKILAQLKRGDSRQSLRELSINTGAQAFDVHRELIALGNLGEIKKESVTSLIDGRSVLVYSIVHKPVAQAGNEAEQLDMFPTPVTQEEFLTVGERLTKLEKRDEQMRIALELLLGTLSE